MKRRAAKVDANQAEIVAALRGIGCSVQSLATSGDGVPDLLVGIRQKNYLLEVKDGNKPPSARKLTPEQVRFHEAWKGQVHIVSSIEEAIEAVKP